MQTKGYKTFKFIETLGGIALYVHKKNGLRVLIWEDHSTPVVALNVTYLVGSRNEAVGHTGATHLLEHLMFKGSKKFNKKTGKPIDQIVFGMGAKANATTWNDRTNYWELLPSERLPELMAVEADRMRGAILDEQDRASEMTVVRNEFERHENEPAEVLDKEIWASAFREHPYHHPTIGWKSDVENMSIERLRAFYNDFYWPNNAYLVLAGDVGAGEALDLAEKYFGKIKSAPKAIPDMYTTEPPQEGERRVNVRRSGEIPIVSIAHKIPAALHEDSKALEVLANVLGKGKSSRLYRAMVDKALVSSIATSAGAFRDGGLLVTTAHLVPTSVPAEIEAMIISEYEKIKKAGITKEELDREIYNAKVFHAFASDGPLGIALLLNEATSLGDWRLLPNYSKQISGVTLEKVKAVANAYLQSDYATVGHFCPKRVTN